MVNFIPKLLNYIKNHKFLLFFIFISIFLIYLSKDYSITWDEPNIQDQYGLLSANWFLHLGRTNIKAWNGYDTFYGPFFETIIGFTQIIFNQFNHWDIRTLVTTLAGLLTLVGLELCSIELGFPFMGILSSLILLLTPRYFGDIFGNSKDIPFAVGMLFTLWAILKIVNNYKNKYVWNSILLGVIIGLTSATRINGIIIWTSMILLYLWIWWGMQFKNKFKGINIRYELIKQIKIFIIVYIVFYITILLVWPFILESPIIHFLQAIKTMAKVEWDGRTTIFNGNIISASPSPWYYIVGWIGITTPIITLILTLIGIIVIFKDLILKKDKKNFLLLLILFSFCIPVIISIFIHASVYNGIRHFLFVIPPMCLIASYGFIMCFKYIKLIGKYYLYTFIGIIILCYFSVTICMIRLHPYEYVYFNEFVGGLRGAYGKYDTDYWGASYRECVQWLSTNYKQYSDSNIIKVYAEHPDNQTQIKIYSPTNFVIDRNPDFYLLLSSFKIPPEYANYSNIVYEVKRDGTPLCTILKK